MDRKEKRQLRNNASCTPFDNIFRDQVYIFNGCKFLPEHIFQKIRHSQLITCDQINSLTFVKNQPHERILSRMNEGFESQSNKINKKINAQSRQSVQRQQAENERVRMIESDDCKEEILNDLSFKNYLEHLLNE